jgi:hypothetical protein
MQNHITTNASTEKRLWLLILILVAFSVRLTPEIIAYPIPIGYDVINYYIPVLTNFENHWNIVSIQYPFYILILHFISSITTLAPKIVVPAAGILVYVLFSVSVYYLVSRLFKLDNFGSFFLSLFVIFQSSLLRTTWDLHKDMLSLTTMFFAIALGLTGKNISRGVFFLVVGLCVVSVLSDRMYGLVLAATLIVYTIMKRTKKEIILSAVTSIVFFIAIAQGSVQIQSNIHFFSGAASNNYYNQIDFIFLFLVTSGILIPFGIVGFVNVRESILKIPLLLSFIGSFLWSIHPTFFAIIPDRWMIIFSIFLSVFSGYGIVILLCKRSAFGIKCKIFPMIVVLVPFIVIGMLFAVSSSDRPISLFAPFHYYIGQFGPNTMQANSISISASKSIISTISWVNQNTPQGSSIVIDKHWRGWTELELKNRSFFYYEDTANLIARHQNYYILISLTSSSLPNSGSAKVQLLHKEDGFLIYEILFNK